MEAQSEFLVGPTWVHYVPNTGADVRTKDKQGRTALMYAASSQFSEIVDALLHSRADVNEEDSSGETALHFAAGLASSSWNLIDTGADYRRPTANFWPNLLPPSPKPEVVALLLAAGADPNAVDFDGATALMYAAEEGVPEVLRALLAEQADMNVQDAEGRTALMYATDHCQTESVRLLVHAGTDVTLKDNNGYTALKNEFVASSRDLGTDYVATIANKSSTSFGLPTSLAEGS